MRQSKRKKAIAQAPNQKSFATGDSFQNLATRTGIGTSNLSTASGYGFTPTTRDRVTLEFAYRSSWIVAKMVDAYAEDMTKAGINFTGDGVEDWQEELQRKIDRMQIWNNLCDTVKWSRLYGGCIAVMMIDGQDTSKPLRLDSIKKDQFRGMLVLDRWVVWPSLQELITDPGPEFGQPKFYDVIADAGGLPNMRIHHSRCIRLDGVDLPYWQKIAEMGWGASVIERLWDRLLAFDSTTQGAAQLVYKAHLRTYKVKNLREIVAMGGKAFEGLVKQIEMIRLYQSNEGLTLMDTEDEFEAHQYTFSGLDNVLIQFGQQLSGAIEMPLVRLFGQEPRGMNSTGESDLRIYYDDINRAQNRRLKYPLHKVLNVMFRSLTGSEPPENFDFVFNPLWQLDDEQKANVANTVSNAVSTVSNAGVIDRATALKALRNSAEVTGIFQSITDEDIKEAEDEPPPMLNEVLGNESDQNKPDSDNEGGKDLRETA